MSVADPTPLYRMTPAETAWGWVTGGPPATDLPPHVVGSPLGAMEATILPALDRPPCVVQFSGGRDSSLVLAVATALARREGMAPPVAFTHRFPAVPGADEDEWQELVIRHLGVADWERVELSDELDIVGPVAAPSLLRHGLLWPPMVHLRSLDFGRAGGGSTLDGEGGDEVLGPGRLAVLKAWARAGRRLRPAALRSAAMAAAPTPVRRIAARRLYRAQLRPPWLKPGTWGQLERAVASDLAAEPLDNRRRLMSHAASNAVARFRGNFRALAAEHDVLVVQPLLEPPVLAAVAQAGGPFGFRDRTAALRQLFPGLLPDAVVSRTTKAYFNEAVFNRHSRDFVAEWDGSGVDPMLVDVAALRAEWASEMPSALTYGLLQSAWLAAR